MKVVGYEMGRLIALFPSEEIRPKDGLYIPTAIKVFQERYGFLKIPDLDRSLDELDREGYKFSHGRINIEGKDIVIAEFGLFSDGISITCFDTGSSELVMNDILNWAQDVLGVRSFAREPRRLYRSQLFVEFEGAFSNLMKKLSPMAAAIEDAMKAILPRPQPVELVRIALGVDPGKIPGLAPVPFSIERKVGTAYEQERYFCEASLPTHLHIQALTRIEKSLSG